MLHVHLYTFIAVLGIAALHLLSGVVPETPRGKNVRSFAGGIALSYVFLHILPDLAKYEVEVLRAIQKPVFPWFEDHMYASALLGVLLAYGVRGRPDQHDTFSYRKDLFSSSMRNLLTGYTIGQQEAVLWPILLMGIAFGAHYWESDRTLLEHYGERFCRTGTKTLTAMVLAGWLVGTVVRLPVRPVAVLFSFLAGGIILNTIRDELPQKKADDFLMLCLGTAAYSAILIIVSSGTG